MNELSNLRCLATIRKMQWVRGEWTDEVDYVEWVDEYSGYKCIAMRMWNMGHLCGYVFISSTHPFFEKDYDELDNVAELTYSEEIDGFRVLGFDCAHYNDVIPCMVKFENEYPKIEIPGNPITYKNIDFVKKTCIALAKALKELQ